MERREDKRVLYDTEEPLCICHVTVTSSSHGLAASVALIKPHCEISTVSQSTNCFNAGNIKEICYLKTRLLSNFMCEVE